MFTSPYGFGLRPYIAAGIGFPYYGGFGFPCFGYGYGLGCGYGYPYSI